MSEGKETKWPLIVSALVAVLWTALLCFGFFQTRCARIYVSRLDSFAAKKLVFLGNVTKVLVVERYPWAHQAPGLRAGVLWNSQANSSLGTLLSQAGFPKKFGSSSQDYIFFLDTPALLPGMLLLGLGGLIASRWRKYPEQKGKLILWRAFPCLGLLSAFSLFFGVIVAKNPSMAEIPVILRVLAVFNVSEFAAICALAVYSTFFCLWTEKELLLGCFILPDEAAPKWVKWTPLLACGACGAVYLMWGIVVSTRVDGYYSLGQERAEAMRELVRYREAEPSGGWTAPQSGYFEDAFDFGALFYSKSEMLRSIKDIRAEVLDLKIKRINAAFQQELGRVESRLRLVERNVSSIPFVLPYKGDLDGLMHRRAELERQGIRSLEQQDAAFGGIRSLSSDVEAFSRRMNADQREFSSLGDQVRRAEESDRLIRLVIGRYSDKSVRSAPYEDILKQALDSGPPFDGYPRRIHEGAEEIRAAAEGAIRDLADDFLKTGSLAKARQLLSDSSDQLGIRLPSEQVELVRLETEQRIRENTAGLVGTWRMTDSGSSFAKNYSITRTVRITAGLGFGQLVVEAAYNNNFKDGMFSKKKTIDRKWPDIGGRVDMDGAHLDFPDFNFSYEERNRYESIHQNAVLQLRDGGQEVSVIGEGRVLFVLRRL